VLCAVRWKSTVDCEEHIASGRLVLARNQHEAGSNQANTVWLQIPYKSNGSNSVGKLSLCFVTPTWRRDAQLRRTVNIRTKKKKTDGDLSASEPVRLTNGKRSPGNNCIGMRRYGCNCEERNHCYRREWNPVRPASSSRWLTEMKMFLTYKMTITEVMQNSSCFVPSKQWEHKCKTKNQTAFPYSIGCCQSIKHPLYIP
jgi:hypothetical protein